MFPYPCFCHRYVYHCSNNSYLIEYTFYDLCPSKIICGCESVGVFQSVLSNYHLSAPLAIDPEILPSSDFLEDPVLFILH